MKNVILIPAYKPDRTLVSLVDALAAEGVGILVVNDGSGAEYDGIFAQVAPAATVLSLPENRGKGAALKYGMRRLKEFFPNCLHFITADADGQHKVSDILRVRDEMENGAGFVLSVRSFRGEVPPRSRVGNYLSRFIYTTLTSHYFRDNQSGLRGFSVEHLNWLVQVGGDKYDYEMNVLYHADKQRIPITTLMIETVYLDGNKSSHFDPLKDTLRIYRQLFSSAWVSFASVGIIEFFLITETLLFPRLPIVPIPLNYWQLLGVLPQACFISVLFNILMNRFVAFRKFRYADGSRVLCYTVLRFFCYTVGCVILQPLTLPLFFNFNLIALILMPLEYLMHKLLHSARYHDVNKESVPIAPQ